MKGVILLNKGKRRFEVQIVSIGKLPDFYYIVCDFVRHKGDFIQFCTKKETSFLAKKVVASFRKDRVAHYIEK